MQKDPTDDDTQCSNSDDPELLVRYLEYVLVDVAAISPSSARLIRQAIQHLHPSDHTMIDAPLTIN